MRRKSTVPPRRKEKWDRQAILLRARRGRESYFCHCVGLILFLNIAIWVSTIMVSRVERQWRSTDFVEAHGKVVKNNLQETRSGKNKTATATIEIVYNVGIEADVRPGTFSSGSLGNNHARWMARTFTVGMPVIVYYNPDDPGEFVLQRGLRGVDVYWLMLIPAGFAGLLGWFIAVVSHGRRAAKFRARLRRAARNRRTVYWIVAIQSAIVVYIGATLSLVIFYFTWTQAADISVAAAGRNWLVIVLLSLAVFVWQAVPRYLSGARMLRRNPRKPRINSSSDRAARGSA